jgi:hypothetical protein
VDPDEDEDEDEDVVDVVDVVDVDGTGRGGAVMVRAALRVAGGQ